MKFKVVFEIEGTQLSDGCFLNKKDLEEMIMMAFDRKNGSPLFDDNLDAKVRNVEIEALG